MVNHQRHGTHHRRINRIFRKRGIKKIFHQNRIHPTGSQRHCFLFSALNNCLKAQSPPRRTRQRQQMDDSNDWLRMFKDSI